MRKVTSHLLAGYAGAVLATLELERRGVLGCGCAEECWCHRPGLRIFRWTIPVGHGGRG